MRSIFIILAVCAASTGVAMAQGLPVKTASPIPVWLMFIGAGILGIFIAYGILRTRSRTVGEKRLTDRATEEVYRAEERRNQQGP